MAAVAGNGGFGVGGGGAPGGGNNNDPPKKQDRFKVYCFQTRKNVSKIFYRMFTDVQHKNNRKSVRFVEKISFIQKRLLAILGV